MITKLTKDDIKNFLRGGAIPGMISTFCGIVGVLFALYHNGLKTESIVTNAKFGLGLGAFLSLLGIGEIIGGIFGLGGFNRKTLFQFLGFLGVWAICVTIILS